MAKKNEKGRYDNGPCPFCGRAIISLDHITKLSDGTEVCRDCVSKIRVMYPLVYGKKKGKGRVAYYNVYTHGLESEIGINYVLFDFLSISMGTDCIFARRVAFDVNITIGVSIDLAQ